MSKKIDYEVSNCAQCGNPCKRKAPAHKLKYCSSHCYWKSLRYDWPVVDCASCGNPFRTNNIRRKYCSRECQYAPEDPDIRFWAKVDILGDAECWEWQAGTSQGYGVFNNGSGSITAHIYSYNTLVGPIPTGLFLDHKCRNRRCVNPNHLRPVTPAVNATENSMSLAALNKVKTHCKRGHPLSGENLKSGSNGKNRRCRACMSMMEHLYRQRDPEKHKTYMKDWHRKRKEQIALALQKLDASVSEPVLEPSEA